MVALNYVLLIIAFACFIADAIWQPNPPGSGRVKLTPLGLAAWMLNQLVILTPR